MGSPEKDLVAGPIVKAAGAEIRPCVTNVRLGVVPVGAPVAKRLALSVLSLCVARLVLLGTGSPSFSTGSVRPA